MSTAVANTKQDETNDNSSLEVVQNADNASETDCLSRGPVAAVDDSVQIDIDLVLQGFIECLTEDGLYIDGYLRAYTEMTKFFDVMGAVFSFVTSDVYSKLNILRCYRKSGSADYYYSIQSTLQYEKDQPCLTQPSASRTLLRLHRALAFVTGFLREMKGLKLETKLGPYVQPVYGRTLAKHHGWFVSKTVSAVILLLPVKRTLLTRLVGDNVTKQKYLESKTDELCDVLDKVYDATESYFSDYEMLNLP